MKNRKAFTLVELLVVIAILGVLATVAIVGYSSFTRRSVESNAQNELAQFISLLEKEDTNNDKFEMSQDGIELGLSEVVTTESDSYNETTRPVGSYYYTLAHVLKDQKEDVDKLNGTFTIYCEIEYNQAMSKYQYFVKEIYYTYTKQNNTIFVHYDFENEKIETVKYIPLAQTGLGQFSQTLTFGVVDIKANLS